MMVSIAGTWGTGKMSSPSIRSCPFSHRVPSGEKIGSAGSSFRLSTQWKSQTDAGSLPAATLARMAGLHPRSVKEGSRSVTKSKRPRRS